MNVFVTDFTVDNVVTHMQGFSSGILIIFFARNCVKCERILINVWPPCMVNVPDSVRSTIASDLHLHKISKFIQKLSSCNNFPNNLFHMKSHISCSYVCLHVNCAC